MFGIVNGVVAVWKGAAQRVVACMQKTAITVSHSSVAAKLHQSCTKVAFCGERGASRTEPCSSPGDHPQSRAPMSRNRSAIAGRTQGVTETRSPRFPNNPTHSPHSWGPCEGPGVRWTTPRCFSSGWQFAMVEKSSVSDVSRQWSVI